MRRRRGSGIPASDLAAVVAVPSAHSRQRRYEGRSRRPHVGRGGCARPQAKQIINRGRRKHQENNRRPLGIPRRSVRFRRF